MPQPPATNAREKVVFVVEDDALLVQIYQKAFGKEGVEVWAAQDGKEALSFLEKSPPTVVLLDLMLPQVSGFEVLTAIRRNEKWVNVPVVIVSNLSRQQDVEKGKTLGAEEYLVKAEIELKDVIERVNRYLS